MRVALIGAGRIGRMHARLLSATPGFDEVVVADAIPERAASVAAEVGAQAAPSIEAALDGAEAVAVAAATDAHAGLVRVAIGRGLPTFCEKPLAADLADTLAVAAEIEASGVPFQLGFQRRFDAGYSEARRLVESGELGTVYVVRLAGHDPEPPHEAYIPASGGLFRDFSIHDFDILRWLTGSEVEEVYADGGVRGFPVFAKYGDVDTAVATLRLSGGAFAVLTSARHDPLGYDIRAELFGSRDSVYSFTILNRGRSGGTYRRGELNAAELHRLMGGGSELEELQADLEMLARREARGEEVPTVPVEPKAPGSSDVFGESKHF